MKPIDISENNKVITSEQVEKPVGCGGTCGGKCGSGKSGKCCSKKCLWAVKFVLWLVAVALSFYAGTLYGQR